MNMRQIQWGLASIFFVLGGWALVAPRHVIELTFLPHYRACRTIARAAMSNVVGCRPWSRS